MNAKPKAAEEARIHFVSLVQALLEKILKQ
jgi:hypothetical protein